MKFTLTMTAAMLLSGLSLAAPADGTSVDPPGNEYKAYFATCSGPFSKEHNGCTGCSQVYGYSSRLCYSPIHEKDMINCIELRSGDRATVFVYTGSGCNGTSTALSELTATSCRNNLSCYDTPHTHSYHVHSMG